MREEGVIKNFIFIIITFFLLPACEDADQKNTSSNPINHFYKAERLLYSYSDKNENKYLTLNSINKINNSVVVELFYQGPLDNIKSNISFETYFCNEGACYTRETNYYYKQIILTDTLEQILINNYFIDSEGHDQLKSTYYYNLVKQ